MIAALTVVKWNLKAVRICPSLMAKVLNTFPKTYCPFHFFLCKFPIRLISPFIDQMVCLAIELLLLSVDAQ